MTDQPACDRCGQPVHDLAYVCAECGRALRRDLELVALLAGEAVTTIARLDRVERPGSAARPDEAGTAVGKAANALYPTPSPVGLAAARDHDAAVSTLTTWARHVAEQSGRPLPTVRTAPCGHATCAGRRRGVVLGPLCPGGPPEHPIAVVAAWLTGRLDWLRHRPEAGEAFDELADACRLVARVVDRAPALAFAGQCGCGVYLYGRPRAAAVTCRGCGTAYDIETTRRAMLDHLDGQLLTAAEIASLALRLGLHDNRQRLRHLINVWAIRGVICARGEHLGRPTYPFAVVATRLRAGLAGVV